MLCSTRRRSNACWLIGAALLLVAPGVGQAQTVEINFDTSGPTSDLTIEDWFDFFGFDPLAWIIDPNPVTPESNNSMVIDSNGGELVDEFSRVAILKANRFEATNVDVAVDITWLDDDDRSGIYLRFVDENNFYYLFIEGDDNDSDEVRLFRMRNGTSERLLNEVYSDVVDIDGTAGDGETHRITFRAIGDQLFATVDGLPFPKLNPFVDPDPLIASGRIGFGEQSNPAAFDNIVATSFDTPGLTLDKTDVAIIDPPVGLVVSIPAGCNVGQAVTYTLVSSDAAVAAPGSVAFADGANNGSEILVSSLAAGTTTFSTTNDGGCADLATATLTVHALQAVNLTLATASMFPGDTQQVSAAGDYAAAGLREATGSSTGTTYASSDDSIATIDAEGKITAIAGGTVDISATNNGVTGTQSLTVEQIESTDLQLVVASMAPRDFQQVTVVGDYGAGGTNNITNPVTGTTYTSSDDAIATIEGNGNIRANSKGTVQITATNAGVSVTETLIVEEIRSVDLQIASAQIQLGARVQVFVVGNFGPAGTRDVTTPISGTTYASSDEAVVSVTAGGLLTAASVGSAQITASNDGQSETETVSVVAELTKIAVIVGDLLNLGAGDQALLDHLNTLRFNGEAPQIASYDDDNFEPLGIDAGFDLLISTASIIRGLVGEKFRCLNIPHIYSHPELNRPIWEGLSFSGSSTDPEGFTDLFPINTDHPIMAGTASSVDMDGFLTVHNTPTVFSLASTGPAAPDPGFLAAGATLLAEGDFIDLATIVAGETGGLRADTVSPMLGRRVFLWVGPDGFASLNAVGLQIYDNAINWALAGERLPLDRPTQFFVDPQHIGFALGSTIRRQVRMLGPVGDCDSVDLNADPNTTFVSGDPSIVEVDATGIATVGTRTGTTTITITNGADSVVADVTVVEGFVLAQAANGGPAAFHFASGMPDDTLWTCPVFNDPSQSYQMVLHAGDQDDAVRSLGYQQNPGRGWGYIQHSFGPDYSAHSRTGPMRENFGPFDQSPNRRGSFFDLPCPESLYGSFIGGVNFFVLCGDPNLGATDGDGDSVATDPPQLGGPCGVNPDGSITSIILSEDPAEGIPLDGDPTDKFYVSGSEAVAFRVDLPIGDYVFIGAWGDADNVHSHTIIMENGGTGDPGNINRDQAIFLLLDLDQAQATVGQSEEGELGEGIFGASTFDRLTPPTGDGIDPDPQLVVQLGDSRVLSVTQAPDLPEGMGFVRMHQMQGASNDGTGGGDIQDDSGLGERDPNGGDAVILEIWRILGTIETTEGPELTSIMDGLGSATDTFSSPLGDNVPFDTIELQLSADAELVSGAGMTLTSNGGGSHTLTLDTPVTPGTCQALSLDVRDTATGGVSTLSVTVCHQPLDINQDGRTNISDATAFGGVFNGSRSAALIDINGNGTVNIQDATAFGVQWATWANTTVTGP